MIPGEVRLVNGMTWRGSMMSNSVSWQHGRERHEMSVGIFRGRT